MLQSSPDEQKFRKSAAALGAGARENPLDSR